MNTNNTYLTAALTGGFGSGKSTAAEMFADWGAEIVDADRLARRALEPKTEQYSRVLEEFGDEILLAGSEKIDRERLGEIVFDSPEKLSLLNSIVHPVVIRRIQEALARMDSPVRIAVIPLLYEVGLQDRFDRVIVVRTDPETAARRVKTVRKMEERKIRQRQSAQLPLAEKAEKADFIIDNNNSLSLTRKQVGEVWLKLNRILRDRLSL